jgi:hypothetical protein
MTISSATSTSGTSPLDMLKQELAREVSAGTVSSSDQSALSSALDDIDSALKNGASSSSSSGSAAPQDMKSKIDDLIQSEVSSGKLTSDQATELKSVFANAFSGHAPGAGGPPPSASGADDSGSSDSSTTPSSTATDTTELLKELLAALQKSISQSPSSYGANGTTSSNATGTSLVLNYTI